MLYNLYKIQKENFKSQVTKSKKKIKLNLIE